MRQVRIQRCMIAFMRGHTDPGGDDRDAAVGEHGVEGSGELAVAVADQVFHAGVSILQVHDQVPCHLGAPGRPGVSSGAEDPDAAGGVLDDG